MARGQLSVALLLLVGLSLAHCGGAFERKSLCSAARDLEMDTCAARMGFLGDHNFRVAKNVSAMNSFCQNLKSSITCIQSYSRDCLQGFTKQILTSLLKRGRAQYTMMCQDDQAKATFISKLSCLADDKIDQLHNCMDASISRFEFIRSNVRSDNRLPALCCSYQIFNRDLNTTLSNICGPRTGSPDSVHEFMQKVVSGTTGEFFQLVCNNHRTLTECQDSVKTKDTLKRLEMVTRNVHLGRTKPKSKSLIPVLLDILDNSAPI